MDSSDAKDFDEISTGPTLTRPLALNTARVGAILDQYQAGVEPTSDAHVTAVKSFQLSSA